MDALPAVRQLQIEQRRKAEMALISARDRAEAANRAKSAFLATMSHELRTPLNAIIGFSSMLLTRRDARSPQATEYLAEINGAGGRLLNLINDILEITQMDTDSECPGELVYPSDVVDAVVEKLQAEAEAAGISLDSMASDCSPALLGDGKRLKRALEHLVGNAIKFSARGSFARIDTRVEEGKLVLELSDNGPGLEPGTVGAVTGLFAQADSSYTRRYEGVGLGLTFVSRVAKYHGATVRIVSAKDEGTRVAFVFPQRRIVAAREVA